jgi:N-acetylneuraminic acid mutarotase
MIQPDFMRQFPDKLLAYLCVIIIAFTGIHCKKDKNEKPPQDHWEPVSTGRERNIGPNNWSFLINDKVFFRSRDGDLHIFDLTKKDWTGTFNYPPGFEPRWNCAVAVHNNKAYIGNGRYGAGQFLGDWWEFDPEASTPWRALPDCPITGADGKAFVYNGKLYNTLHIDGGTGNETIQTRVYILDLTTFTWEPGFKQMTMNCGSSGFGLMLDDQFLFGAGYNNRIPGSIFTKECGLYNPANQQTRAIANFPVEMQTTVNAITFTHNGKGYVLGKNRELFEYDPAGNKWRSMNKLPEQAAHGAITYLHSHQDKIYGFTTKGYLYRYVPE